MYAFYWMLLKFYLLTIFRDISNPESNSVAIKGETHNRPGEKEHREIPKEKKKGGKKKGTNKNNLRKEC